tara:strand:+ start:2159 stop:4393 length:2235 start_codon:yes stop_codon:yes gene_type:complete
MPVSEARSDQAGQMEKLDTFSRPDVVAFQTDDRAEDVDDAGVDPLLACLAFLTRHYQRPYSASVLKAGLPLEAERITPSLFVRAASRAGLAARIAKHPLGMLAALTLPAVLVLKDDSAVVALERQPDGSLLVMTPEAGDGVESVALSELEDRYAGYVIFVRPEYRFRAPHETNKMVSGQRWLRDHLWQNWWIYGQVLLAAVLINVFALTSPLFIMTVYDRVVPNNAMETLTVLAIGAAVVFTFEFLVRGLRGYFIDVAGRRADVALASHTFDHLLDVQMAARPRSSGAFANTMRDFESLRDFFTSATLAVIVDLPFILLFVAVIWGIGGSIALIPAVAVPAVLFVGIIVQAPLTRIVQQAVREAEAKHGVLFETLGGLETIKSTGGDSRMRHRWETFVGLAAQSGLKARVLSTLALNITAYAQQFAAVAIVVYGVILISQGELSMGGLIACVILNGRAVAALAQVAGLLVRLHHARASYRSLNGILRLPVERSTARTFLHRPRLQGRIEFRGVSFNYPGQSFPALRDASFVIEPGERAGIIGRVGSGKTTVAKMVLGLYTPDDGTVLLDGTEVRQIDPVDLRSNIGVAPQDIILFGGTVRENIAFGQPHATDERVLEAARLAGVEEFVAAHPQGYDMPVGERGEGLSGGQRQAIAVARALLGDPPILLLDEPTNHMDHGAETLLRTNLQTWTQDKTLLLITHRVSMLPLVDRLIVLDGGQVVADGEKQKVLDAISDGRVSAIER